MVLRMERTFFLAPPTNSRFSASCKLMIQASPSIEVELCLFCNATLSLLSRSNPSIFTCNCQDWTSCIIVLDEENWTLMTAKQL